MPTAKDTQTRMLSKEINFLQVYVGAMSGRRTEKKSLFAWCSGGRGLSTIRRPRPWLCETHERPQAEVLPVTCVP